MRCWPKQACAAPAYTTPGTPPPPGSIAQGVPARAVMELLGHSQIGLTLGTYTHAPDVVMREAADRMGAALWS